MYERIMTNEQISSKCESTSAKGNKKGGVGRDPPSPLLKLLHQIKDSGFDVGLHVRAFMRTPSTSAFHPSGRNGGVTDEHPAQASVLAGSGTL